LTLSTLRVRVRVKVRVNPIYMYIYVYIYVCMYLYIYTYIGLIQSSRTGIRALGMANAGGGGGTPGLRGEAVGEIPLSP